MSDRRPPRATAALLAIVLAGAAGAALVSARTATTEAQRAELAAAGTDLSRDLTELRRAFTGPTHAVQQTTAALNVIALEALTGSDRAPASVRADADRLSEQLRTDADRLDAAAGHRLPERPDALPIAAVDPLYARLAPLTTQAADVADHLRATAARVEALAAGAIELQEAAAAYAESSADLPEGEDPDDHAAAWRAERERLADYRAATDTAADVDGLARTAAAHAFLIDALEELAEDALEALEAGDVDAYNDRVAAGVGDDTLEQFHARLQAGVDEAAESAAIAQLERARGLSLGMLKELETIRRASTTVALTQG